MKLVGKLAAAMGPGLALGLVLVSTPVAADAVGDVRYAWDPRAVPGSYVVVLADEVGTVPDLVQQVVPQLAKEYGAAVRFTYTTALKGFAGELTEHQARRLAADPRVEYVAQDLQVKIESLPGTDVIVQPAPPSWGLDRIDQRSLPLDAKYHYPSTARTARAYVVDTGIRFTHVEFGRRAVLGIDTVGDGQNGNDCQGHGTHMAGTIGGATVGVAKQVTLVSVRVLNCSGSGSFAQVIAGIDWITLDNILNPRPSVANMSLGGGAYQPLDDAVTNSIDANVHYSVAAGGSNADACFFSPARVPRATTAGATSNADARAPFSNFGPCLDVWAPGIGITSAWHTADNAYNTISGTSPSAAPTPGVPSLWRPRVPADSAAPTPAATASARF